MLSLSQVCCHVLLVLVALCDPVAALDLRPHRNPHAQQHTKRAGTLFLQPTSSHLNATVSPFISASADQRITLTRLPTQHSGNGHLHPAIVLGQHRHRSIKRHAEMTGRPTVNMQQLKDEIAKRWESIQVGMLIKRQRDGLAMAGKEVDDYDIAHLLKGKLSPNIGFANATTGSEMSGYSQAELDAANLDSVTPAIAPTVANTLGLDIEANDIGKPTPLKC